MSANKEIIEFLCLESMPTEILLNIFNFLDANFVANVLSLVCQRFFDLLNDSSVWKSRMLSKFPEKYLILPNVKIDWKQACVEREEHYNCWSNYHELTDCITLREIHLANIDSYKMLQDTPLLAAASRDRSYSIWNLEKLHDENEVFVHHEENAHAGWIWCILGCKDKFFTGSWDSTIKAWDLNSFENTDTIKCVSNILCLAEDQGTLFAGLFSSKIIRIDLREPEPSKAKSLSLSFHKASVLDLAVVKEYHLASVSEDCKLNIIDWRMEKILHSQMFADFPSCLSFNNNQIWVGDKGGNIHLINPQTYEILMTRTEIHKKLVTGIKNSIGSVTTSSKDGSICILEPTLAAHEIARISNPYKMEITGFERYNNMLISSVKSGCDLAIWAPKSQ